MKSELKNVDELIGFLKESGIKYLFVINGDLSIEKIINISAIEKSSLPSQLLFFKKADGRAVYGYIMKMDEGYFRVIVMERGFDLNTAFHWSISRLLNLHVLSEVV